MAHRATTLALAVLMTLGVGEAAPAQGVAPARVVETTLELGDATVLRYGIALPAGYDAIERDPRPLVLALHPGGRGEYYGSAFMQGIVEPALRAWRAIIVAPDVPDRSWATPRSERAVMALLERVMSEHAIDPGRVLVTGFSMGGRGTWYMAARHAGVLTGAIVMAGSPSDQDIQTMEIPIFLIHSPDDEVVPFGPAEAAYTALAARGHPVEMRVLPGASHYMMGAYVPVLRVAGSWMLERWAEVPRARP
jgi:predicted peptidase